MQLAARLANADGGVDGHPIQLSSLDVPGSDAAVQGVDTFQQDGIRIVMGSYGIGPGRVLAAAVEQNGEEGAIRWPAALAPFDVEVVSLHAGSDEILGRAEQLAAELDAAGLDVLLDDRDARPGEKFADADLIGAPIRITVGKKTLEDGAVDVRNHASDERVPLAEVAARVGALR